MEQTSGKAFYHWLIDYVILQKKKWIMTIHFCDYWLFWLFLMVFLRFLTISLSDSSSVGVQSTNNSAISLAYMLSRQGENVKVISDDYTIQNTLKIMDIPYSGVITEGIKGVYNWKKVCEGCKKEYGEDYPFDDCEICGSKIYKKRIKVDKWESAL